MPKAGIFLQGKHIHINKNMIYGKIWKNYRGPNCETGFYNQTVVGAIRIATAGREADEPTH